jgi:rod shape-determining protein MreC
MMRASLRDRRRTIAGAVAVALLAALVASPWREAAFGPAFAAARALLARTHAAAAGVKAKLARPTAEELVRLSSSNELLSAENARLRSVIAENEALKAALDYRDTHDDEAVTAKVLAGGFSGDERSLFIDKGTRDGLAKGQVALSPAGMAVGKVLSVEERTAVVALVADGRARLAVTVMAPEPVDGILEGERGTAAVVPLIPERADVPVGTPIVTAGLEPGIRRGVPVGVVERVEKGRNEPFQRAYLDLRGAVPQPAFVNVLVGSTTTTSS